jgi:hypothetical protein
LCWNLNVLLQKIGTGKNTAITLSWMSYPVTDLADNPPQIVAECCRSVASTHPIRPSRDRNAGGSGCLRDHAVGWKIGRSIK